MFFARPWSEAQAELFILVALWIWILLMIPGRAAALAKARKFTAVAAPLVLATGAYALAFKTQTIRAHHELLDLRSQSGVCCLLILTCWESLPGAWLRRGLGLFAAVALVLHGAAPERFVNGLRHGLLGLNGLLGLALAVATLRGLVSILRAQERAHV